MSPHTYRHAARWNEPSRSTRRQQQAKRLHRCGPRIVLEALIHTEAGVPLDTVLESLCSISPADYADAGVADLPIDRPLDVIKGGRK